MGSICSPSPKYNHPPTDTDQKPHSETEVVNPIEREEKPKQQIPYLENKNEKNFHSKQNEENEVEINIVNIL